MGKLETISIEKLQRRNTGRLEKAGYSPEINIDGLQWRQRRRINRLLNEKGDINQLSSVTPQQEAFGMERWNQQFTLLKDINFIQGANVQGAKLRWMIWNALPSSRFKVFQETFCRRENWMVPKCEVIGDEVHFPKGIDFDSYPLDGCLVSPDCVKDEFAERMGMAEFTEEDERKPLSRLRKKAAPEAIARLKEIGESLAPMGLGERRIFTITDENPDIEGTILYFRHHKTRSEDKPNKARIVQHFESAYDTLRKTEHQERGYRRERKDLAGILHQTTMGARRLLEWKRESPAEEKQDMVSMTNDRLESALEPLVNAQDPRKVHARGLLQDSANVQDSLGRTNPRSTSAKMMTANQRVKGRVKDMNNKGAFNAKDSGIVRSEIDVQERVLLSIREGLLQSGTLLEDTQDLNGNSELLAEHAQRIYNLLYVDPEQMLDKEGGVTLQPLLTYAKLMALDMPILKKAKEARNRPDMRDAVLRMQVVGKFQGARKCLEWLNQHIIDPTEVAIPKLREGITRMRTFLESHQIVPNFHIPEHDAAFHSLCDYFKLIQEQLEACTSEDMRFDEIPDRIEKLGEFIDTIDCEGMAKALPRDAVSRRRPTTASADTQSAASADSVEHL